MSRVLRAVGYAAVLIVIACASLALSARLHLETRVGRRALADAIEGAVDSQIQGNLRIEEIEDVSDGRILARRVEFLAPGGDVVLRLDRAELEPDLRRLLSERCIATRSGRIDGGLLRMEQGRGGLSLEQALDSPPDPGGQSGAPPSVFIDFDGIHFEGLATRWRLDGAPSFRIEGVSGFTRIRTDERGNVVLRFDRVAGRLQTSGLPIDVSAGMRRGSGRIHAGWERLGLFDLELDIAGSVLELELELVDRGDGLDVRTRTRTDGISLAWLVGLGVDLVGGDG